MSVAGTRARSVAIDARWIGHQGGGFSTYQRELVRGLSRLEEDSSEWSPVFLASAAGAEWISATWREQGRTRARIECVDIPFLHPREWWELPRLLKRMGAELFHSTTFMSLPAGLMPCPWIVTIHDLNHLRFGTWAQKAYYRLLLASFARGARNVFTVSDFSRREIGDWLEIPQDRISIAWNALEPGLEERIPEPALARRLAGLGLAQGRYVISLSNPKPHKNLKALVEGHALYRKTADPERWLELALTVPSDFSAQPGVHCLGPVPSDDARALVQGAAGAAFPSVYEGFGLPPVEAIAQGVPVACTDIQPHREGLAGVTSDCVAWVPETEARDPAAWSRAFERMEKGLLRRPSVEVSADIRHRFSCDRLGATMAVGYRAALSGGRNRGA